MAEGAEFFGLDANYLIQPGETPQALLLDARCLLGAGLDALEILMGDPKREADWAPVYLLRQALGIIKHLQVVNERQEAANG